jgi:hypothetical protein
VFVLTEQSDGSLQVAGHRRRLNDLISQVQGKINKMGVGVEFVEKFQSDVQSLYTLTSRELNTASLSSVLHNPVRFTVLVPLFYTD